MERRKPIHISEAIKELLNKNNLSRKLDEITIQQSWEKVVGKTMAKYTKRVYINNRIMYVEVTSSVARNELSMNRSTLLEKLNAETGRETIIDIIFR